MTIDSTARARNIFFEFRLRGITLDTWMGIVDEMEPIDARKVAEIIDGRVDDDFSGLSAEQIAKWVRSEMAGSSAAWRILSETDRPRPFEPFLIEWDGGWQRSTMGSAITETVTVTWHGDSFSLPLTELFGRHWMRVPRLPKNETPK